MSFLVWNNFIILAFGLRYNHCSTPFPPHPHHSPPLLHSISSSVPLQPTAAPLHLLLSSTTAHRCSTTAHHCSTPSPPQFHHISPLLHSISSSAPPPPTAVPLHLLPSSTTAHHCSTSSPPQPHHSSPLLHSISSPSPPQCKTPPLGGSANQNRADSGTDN